MRDVTRIPKVMRAIQEVWSKYPDVRFNQLLDTLQREYANEKEAYREVLYRDEENWGMVKVTRTDLFYVEDDDFLEFLQNKLKEYNKDGRNY